MGMKVTEARSLFRSRTMRLADAYSDAEIDVYLNRSLRSFVPAKVPGMLTEGRWTVTTTPATMVYRLPSNVYTPGALVYYQKADDFEPLPTHTSYDLFCHIVGDPETSQEGEPTRALLTGGFAGVANSTAFGHALRIWPRPPAATAYTLTGWGRLLKTEAFGDFDADGGLHDLYADAVLASAVHKWALDNHNEVVAAREGPRLDDALRELKIFSDVPRERVPRWSY